MGGTIRYPGNASPLAEYNVYVDPHAAHIVFHSGMRITLVPLDVTYQCILTPEDVKRFKKILRRSAGSLRIRPAFTWNSTMNISRSSAASINDPLALALTFAPELCDYQELYVDVDISGGVSMGNNVCRFPWLTKKPANMKVALGVRARDFMELFLERMEKLARSMTPTGTPHDTAWN